MTITELRKEAKLKRTEFCTIFGIPYRTVEDWEKNPRQCKDYIVRAFYYTLVYKGYIEKNSNLEEKL